MRFYFEEAELWENHKREVFHTINSMGLPLVLFGRSKNVDASFLSELQVPVQHVCSNNPKSWGLHHWGLEVISPEQMQKVYQDYTVLILAVDSEYKIRTQLQKLPVPPAEIFTLDLHCYLGESHSAVESAGYFQKTQCEIENIYERLMDQESKDTYEALIRYHINRDPNYLVPVALPEKLQYFPAALGNRAPFLSSDEVFVDAGAFTGDTVDAFLSAVRGKYQHIYALEPEDKNYKKLLKSTEKLQNISCLKYGIGGKPQTLHISSSGSSSVVIADESKESIQVETLDNLLKEAPVTYLKMDIEGMECPALRGAQNLIRTYHPKLAICSYHSNEDMVMVPKLILELDPSYQLYMRHYTLSWYETVCYAI